MSSANNVELPQPTKISTLEGDYQQTQDFNVTIEPHNPVHPTRLASITVRFKPSAATSRILGGGLRSRETSMIVPTAPSMSLSTSSGGMPTSPPPGVSPSINNTSSPLSMGSNLTSVATVSIEETQNHPSPNLTAPRRKTIGSIPTSGVPGMTQSSFAPSGAGFANSSRPRNGFKGTNSTFIRSADGLPLPSSAWKNWHAEGHEKEVHFVFYTKDRGVFWVEVGRKTKDTLCKFQFSTYPTALSANAHTSSPERIDLLVGFHTGDILWMDPMIGKYTRLNKGGMITSSPVTSIHWLPGTDNQFLTTHMDGTLLIWDKEREDTNTFSPSNNPISTISVSNRPLNILGGLADEEGPRGPLVTRTGVAAVDKKAIMMAMRCNPVSHWRVSTKPILNAAFAPDRHRLATVGEDGVLRIFDLATERLLDSYASYFGGLTCVCWSPSGRFLVTGGQDDLLTVYAPSEQRVVARCPGHSSFVTGVTFDPWRCDPDERSLRFASVSEDCKIIFWDMSSATLQRPKLQHHVMPRRYSGQSTFSLTLGRRRTLESNTHLPLTTEHREPEYHPPLRRDTTNTLLPMVVKQISNDVLVSLSFHPNHLITLSRGGQIKVFSRPPFEDVQNPSGLKVTLQSLSLKPLQPKGFDEGSLGDSEMRSTDRDAGVSLGLMQKSIVEAKA